MWKIFVVSSRAPKVRPIKIHSDSSNIHDDKKVFNSLFTLRQLSFHRSAIKVETFPPPLKSSLSPTWVWWNTSRSRNKTENQNFYVRKFIFLNKLSDQRLAFKWRFFFLQERFQIRYMLMWETITCFERNFDAKVSCLWFISLRERPCISWHFKSRKF